MEFYTVRSGHTLRAIGCGPVPVVRWGSCLLCVGRCHPGVDLDGVASGNYFANWRFGVVVTTIGEIS